MAEAPVWQKRQYDRSASVAEVPVWQKRQCGRSTSVAEVPVWQKRQCGRSASVEEAPVWQKRQCGRSASVAEAPVWQKRQCGRSASVFGGKQGHAPCKILFLCLLNLIDCHKAEINLSTYSYGDIIGFKMVVSVSGTPTN